MNTDCCLQCCSSTELRTTQKRIANILKTRQRKASSTKHSKNCSQISSRSSSRCSGKSKKSKKSVAYNFNLTTTKSSRRSQSLIDLKEDFSNLSATCVDSINKKYQAYNFDALAASFAGQTEPESVDNSDIDDEDDDDDNDENTKSVSLSTSLSHVTFSTKVHGSETCKTQYQKLSNAVKRLYAILDDVHASIHDDPKLKKRSRSQSVKILEKKPIPSSFETDCILKLAGYVENLTKNVHKRVSSLVARRRKEKHRLDESANKNAILKQRLNNVLTLQKNLEGELQELNKEKKLLEVENKNLAIKIVPFLNDSSNNRANNNGSSSYYQSLKMNDEDARNNNTIAAATENYSSGTKKTSYSSKGATGTKSVCAKTAQSVYRCSRRSSSAGLTTAGEDNDHDYKVVEVSRSASDSNLTVDSTTGEDISRAEDTVVQRRRQRCKSRDELDSIASYVKWKHLDFERLHGKLHKNFEEMKQLKETMVWMTKEKTEILSDLEDLVDSYRELERERDNYESILKMILKEKNSPESNIRDLLDSLLLQLNKANNQTQGHCCHLSDCSSNPSSHRSSSRNFLESALHVIQEQNIWLREEMARMRESLQKTNGQNTMLQTNNESLLEKVNDLQRQMDSKGQEAEQREKDNKEKFEQLDKLYNTISSAKEDLENRLQEKEKEIADLKLKNITDASDKALNDQAEKIQELKEANVKLEREVARLKTSNEKYTQITKHYKMGLKEESRKWTEKVNSACNELQKSKDQCNWLQSQIDNLKVQLVEAHEKIKAHEKDKSTLAHKVLVADEERKTLDRNIHEIRNVMQADKLYQQALTARNEVLQSEVNRLRTERLNTDSNNNEVKVVETSVSSAPQPQKSHNVKKEEGGDGRGEQKNYNNLNVKTAVATVNSSKSKPAKANPALVSNSRSRNANKSTGSSGSGAVPIQRQRPSTAKTVPTTRHSKCSVCRPVTAEEKTGCSAHQRATAAQRLAKSLSNSSPRRGVLKGCYATTTSVPVKTVASSGRQDSTQTPTGIVCRPAASAQEVRAKPSPNALHCTSENPSPSTAVYRDITPLSRKHRHHHASRKHHHSEVPHRTVSLNDNSAFLCRK